MRNSSHSRVDDRAEVGLVSATNGDGRPLLAYDCDKHHAVGPRARALIFNDPRSRALLPLIERIAPSDANVLIMGETGTGKELVARYVHSLSNRAHTPFVAVNCGAFSESLIEGELFGYEKGAFTGANVARPGWFEAANGGTLFLDELGDLSLPLQVKLLRVLQEREVVRLGSRKAVPLNVRVIAATNVELQQAVNEGRFRSDLFYRLQVVSIPLLPLRERRADILPLARHFLEIYGTRAGANRLELSAAAEEALFQHSWPGNIRELENAIHRGTLICEEGRIQPADLGLGEVAGTAESSGDGSSLEEAVRPFIGRLLKGEHDQLLDRLVAFTVTEAFRQCGENQIKTAEVLGITRNVVRTHLKNLDLI
ncbi:sigma-54-dependent Fis family transcriptional regulator [Sphingomonadales bacterium 56]|uniref:Sigma-54 dependent transcriptional regulator n=1 Tax=Sphingobium agri TaxID=2933566 RepID=A0ABT0DYY0_9SPHN|nr:MULTISPECIES: sigma-54 dependent transcriptional regulator [Sphingobium]MBY2928948.1 sigma-54-dependent Fis family transcriptional regulator [Sphingomonadales bacterium 56]MBY2959200.1 sigma-54-dependent Fis family transcriptional regulator [Sphingomonadales bacterium 58]MCK0532331.1 sigma-54 dependent transcriptional regulator [Sphingobium agri]CAD7338288.1 Sigma54-dependent transcriptional activator SfnR [Sphingobium sp. S6]CAD7338681.1 Sigma54-dependent transcriptional activator SfnR [Sp